MTELLYLKTKKYFPLYLLALIKQNLLLYFIYYSGAHSAGQAWDFCPIHPIPT